MDVDPDRGGLLAQVLGPPTAIVIMSGGRTDAGVDKERYGTVGSVRWPSPAPNIRLANWPVLPPGSHASQR